MSDKDLGVVAIGNALVDVLSHASEDFIEEQAKEHGMERGAMTLIERLRAVELYALMGQGTEVSGGSAANTMAAYASFGGQGGFIGKVADDQLGEIFRHDMKASGIEFETPALVAGEPTGRCLILVSEDGTRTMNTFLGAAVELGEHDIDEDIIKRAQVLYLEGYLFDRAQAKAAFRKAAKIAKDNGTKVALTLSDPFCVDRHKEDFMDLVDNHVDILFANEAEIKALYDVFEWDQVPAIVQQKNLVAALTRGEKGSTIMTEEEIYDIEGISTSVKDTTGAGDAYAAGFLYGYTENMGLYECGELATKAATEVIQIMGPRTDKKLSDLISKAA
ncbi:MAG: adenosine kinase [Pseudomonadota bacterium]